MRIFKFLCALVFAVLVIMIEVAPDHATSALSGWFRDGGLTKIAGWFDNPSVDHVIRSYAIWVLGAIAVFCILGPKALQISRYLWGKRDIAITPDMKVSAAIDYIVNDSIAIPRPSRSMRPEAHGTYPPDAIITISGVEHRDARSQLNSKLNTGHLKSWGRRQINTHIPNQFEPDLREIPKEYWNEMQLDFQSCLYYTPRT